MSAIAEEIQRQKLPFAAIVIGAACVILALLFEWAEPLYFVVILICGIPIIWGAIMGVLEDHDITADVLVSIAIVAAVLIGEYESAADVAVIMQIGAFLEEATVNRANSQLVKLEGLTPNVARVVSGGRDETVPIEKVRLGDTVRIAPGEIIPVDGVVAVGSSSVDTSMLTGESVPVDIAPGDSVSSGTTNMFGSIDVTVDRVGEDATAARMARMLELASANRSRIVRTADRVAVYIVVIALSVAILTYLFTMDAVRAVTVLVVFCPCALILATPTAIMAAAANMSTRGVLVKNGGALEALAGVDTVLMDKTGTLTTGTMSCMGFESTSDVSAEEIAHLVSSLESRSEHPLGKAIAKYGNGNSEVEGFEYLPGQGVKGTVDGRSVVAGNARMMADACPEGLDTARVRGSLAESDGYTVIYAGIDGRTVGIAMVADTVRNGSAATISELRDLGLETIMLTGDNGTVAKKVSSSLGMDDVVWECLPEDKLKTVEAISKDHRTCMIGDGINDAPSLKLADVGISMGGIGSRIARDSSDIVFMKDDVSKLPGVIRLSRRTLLTIKVGIAFSLILNTLAMVMAVMGWMGPVAGALVHNIGSVIVIIAAAMLLKHDCWSDSTQDVPDASPATA
ncbi:MAG: cation-translocating P-type ATPase [Thermoplasmata archaeon]|nr:cation-translocating P-type ATPase [Thermoplasmata archaeon]